MSHRQFFLQLSLLSCAAAALLYALHQLPRLRAYAGISWTSMAFFILLSILLFLAGRRAALSDNKYTFINTVVGFTAGKMMLAVLIILAYREWAAPADKWFILPFFSIYLIYTIFETYFMMRLGRMNADTPK